jgi:hypothetical protein
MTAATFHKTKEDIRKPESKASRRHNGHTSADSNVSAMKAGLKSS